MELQERKALIQQDLVIVKMSTPHPRPPKKMTLLKNDLPQQTPLLDIEVIQNEWLSKKLLETKMAKKKADNTC